MTIRAKKSVIVASQDGLQRARFQSLVNGLDEFEIIALTADLMNTYNEVEASLPKAVLISQKLASLPEFEVMRALFAALDVRWLVITGHSRSDIEYFDSKFGQAAGSDIFAIGHDATKLEVEQQLCSLTRTSRSRIPLRKPMPGQAHGPSLQSLRQESSMTRMASIREPLNPVRPAANQSQSHVILIGASTGGVDALLKVLGTFPADCPPTLIVQHTGVGFGESLVGLLDRQCAASVRLAQSDMQLARGMVIVGAGTSAHLVFKQAKRYLVGLETAPAMSGHCPSVDMLFHSAVDIAPSVTAALLTGMGRDGAAGLKELRCAGAHTIAQDEQTSVVYGMPRAAVEHGAAEKILPIQAIGPALLDQSASARAPNRMTP